MRGEREQWGACARISLWAAGWLSGMTAEPAHVPPDAHSALLFRSAHSRTLGSAVLTPNANEARASGGCAWVRGPVERVHSVVSVRYRTSRWSARRGSGGVPHRSSLLRSCSAAHGAVHLSAHAQTRDTAAQDKPSTRTQPNAPLRTDRASSALDFGALSSPRRRGSSLLSPLVFAPLLSPTASMSRRSSHSGGASASAAPSSGVSSAVRSGPSRSASVKALNAAGVTQEGANRYKVR